MVKKGLAVWILGSLTFLSGLHSLDGFLWLTGNESGSLFLGIYPFTRFFEPINPMLYLLGSLLAVFLLWGGTTVVALQNPIETFLGKVLEDGKKENQADVELLEARTSILEMMSETLQNNSSLLAGLRDVVFNVRSEVLNIEPLRRNMQELKADTTRLKKMMKHLEREVKKYRQCPACGRKVLPEFRLCPYCGENLLKPMLDNEAIMLSSMSKNPRTSRCR
ncbi:MAG: zinc-ribbon domain-containing protein [Candidatus Bathyarchaeota archaeon]|nr:MAG: zinc-ribbon domain-containing protein [Candidatus Bathyarchaeota archaeon]